MSNGSKCRLEYSYFYLDNLIHMIRPFKFTIFLPIAFVSISVFSQKNAVYEYGDNEYMQGLQLYEKEKYGAARHVFDELLEAHSGSRSEVLSEASFYRAMSAVELRNDDAAYLVHTFISTYPESPHVNEAVFRLADYFYDKNSWPRSISWYNRVDRHKLTQKEFSEYHFKKGYSYYMRKDFESARVEFYEILEINSSYQAPATYYYSPISAVS